MVTLACAVLFVAILTGNWMAIHLLGVMVGHEAGHVVTKAHHHVSSHRGEADTDGVGCEYVAVEELTQGSPC